MLDQIQWGEGENEGKKKKRKKKKRKEKKEEEKMSEKFHLLSKIYGDRAIDFSQSKRQSSSTRRELRIGIRTRGFLQTPRGRGFSHTLVIFVSEPLNGVECFRAMSGRMLQSQNFGTKC